MAKSHAAAGDKGNDYAVRNWQQFQHYKDRNPPWIKLHFELLASADWVMLNDSGRVLAIACMLVASRNGGRIDCSEQGLAYLKRVAYLKQKPNLKPLINCGFLVPTSKSKQMLAPASVSVSVSEREEGGVGEGERIPAGLNLAVWERWRSYREKIKKPIKPVSVLAAQRKLAACGDQQATVVEQSIANGWQGLFPNKPVNGKPHRTVEQQAEQHRADVNDLAKLLRIQPEAGEPWARFEERVTKVNARRLAAIGSASTDAASCSSSDPERRTRAG